MGAQGGAAWRGLARRRLPSHERRVICGLGWPGAGGWLGSMGGSGKKAGGSSGVRGVGGMEGAGMAVAG